MKTYRVLTGDKLTASYRRDTNRQLLCVHAKLPPYRKLRRFIGNGLRCIQLAGGSAFRFMPLGNSRLTVVSRACVSRANRDIVRPSLIKVKGNKLRKDD